jgi:hypothetical protein
VLDDAADVVERGFGQVGVEVAGKRAGARSSTMTDARACRSRCRPSPALVCHEGRRLAVLMSHVPDDVFVDLHVVGGVHE